MWTLAFIFEICNLSSVTHVSKRTNVLNNFQEMDLDVALDLVLILCELWIS